MVNPSVTPNLIRFLSVAGLTTPVVFLLSIPVAFINSKVAGLMPILILPLYILVDRNHKRFVPVARPEAI